MRQYAGGYYTIPTELMKDPMGVHSSALKSPVSDTVLAALNLIQGVPWRINPFVLQVMQRAYDLGSGIAGLPAVNPRPIPPRLEEAQWNALTRAEQADLKLTLSRLHGENARAAAKREGLVRRLVLASELVDEPGIWFPHALDFRGRVYPLPQDLNPQGDDATKALLMFAEGKPLGEMGLRWLAIALANAAGRDKDSLTDRMRWTHSQSEAIVATADEPFSTVDWWGATDDRGEPVLDAPWTFLALAAEWAAALRSGSPEGYVSHVPVAIDATCSGLQHLSAAGLDEVGGRATNLMNTGRREDVYLEVATRAAEIVERDLRAGSPEAVNWSGRVTRAVVKRAVMTTPYGVTLNGIRDQLIYDGHCRGLAGHTLRNAQYMTNVIQESLSSTIVAAKGIMSYVQGVASRLAGEGLPLAWIAPSGFTVQQAYYKQRTRTVTTVRGKFEYPLPDADLGVDARKMALAAAPNWVHSRDAAHLCHSVLRAWSDYGISSLAVVHDSFGTHACDVDALGCALREEFVEMYRQDPLADLERDVLAYAPQVELPARPTRGSLDIEGVVDSPYFCS